MVAYLSTEAVRKVDTGEYIVTGTRPDGSQIVQVPGGRVKKPKTVWTGSSYDAGQYGTGTVLALLPGRRFPFPKSLYAVEDTLRYFVADKPQAVIVDFFAGSGTTAHAVMRLNRQDGGRRQSISITNNEVSASEQRRLSKDGLRPGDDDWEQWGICDYITKPRLAAAITGKTPDGSPVAGDYKFTDIFPMADGLEENIEFFSMTYEAPRSVAYHRSFPAIAPLLWLRAGARGSRIEQATGTYAVADAYAVLFDLDHSGGFVAAINTSETIRTVFIVSDDQWAFQAVCTQLPGHLEPVRLYSSYLESFRLNVVAHD